MTVRPVRATPALLQVDAILRRLAGRDGLQEVCRYLRHEFSPYRWVGVYRVDGPVLRLEGAFGPGAEPPGELPRDAGAWGRAVATGATVFVPEARTAPGEVPELPDARSAISVPVRAGALVIGVVRVLATEVGGLDASDGAFLERVAGKLADAVASSASGTIPGAPGSSPREHG